jgi:hypothetical protein
MDKEVIADAIMEILRTCVESIAMPTGKLLLPTLGFSASVTVVSAASKLLGLASFVRWEGAALATLLLLGLCVIEMGEENEVSKMYSTAKSRVRSIAGRRKNASAGGKIEGSADGFGEDCRKSGRVRKRRFDNTMHL